MTNKTYDLPAIVAQVRSAGNPQMAAMEAVADNEYLVDSELLEALGVASFGDLPTTPYPDAPMRTRPDSGGQDAPSGQSGPAAKPRKKPGPKPGSRRKQSTLKPAAARKEDPKEAPKEAGDKPSGPSPVERVKAVVESLGSGLAGLNVFMKNWMGVLTQPDGVFPSDQVFTLTSCTEKAASYLAGMYAAVAMIEQEEKKDAGHQD